MAARYIIFDGHIPVVFPSSFPFNSISLGVLERGGVEKETSHGECLYDPNRGWMCFLSAGGLDGCKSKADAEILNRHLCN